MAKSNNNSDHTAWEALLLPPPFNVATAAIHDVNQMGAGRGGAGVVVPPPSHVLDARDNATAKVGAWEAAKHGSGSLALPAARTTNWNVRDALPALPPPRDASTLSRRWNSSLVVGISTLALVAFLLVAVLWNNVYVVASSRARATLPAFERAATVAAARTRARRMEVARDVDTAAAAEAAAEASVPPPVQVLDAPEEVDALMEGNRGAAVLMLFSPTCTLCEATADALVGCQAWAAARGITLAAVSTSVAPGLLRLSGVTGTPALFCIHPNIAPARPHITVRSGVASSADIRAWAGGLTTL